MIERFRRDENKKVNNEKVNELVRTGNRVLNILYILFIILLVYVLGLILKEWKILNFIGKILSIISPLFIGWLIAWLLHPLVNKLREKGIEVGTGIFGADMKVSLLNDGPFTILLDSAEIC